MPVTVFSFLGGISVPGTCARMGKSRDRKSKGRAQFFSTDTSTARENGSLGVLSEGFFVFFVFPLLLFLPFPDYLIRIRCNSEGLGSSNLAASTPQ